MITFLSIAGVIGFLFFIYLMLKTSKEEKEYERKLKESLKDEHLIDPETGVKLTLEEAESGHWIAHDNEFRTMPESDIEKLITDGDKQAEIALNYLRGSKSYIRIELTDKQFELFNSTTILSNYDNWSYSNSFSFENGILLLPAPEIHGMTYYQDDYKESQVMVCKKIKNINGHYYLREKSGVEKFFDKFRNENDLNLKGYESFTIRKSYDLIIINQLLENFTDQKGLEIEINDEHLFIKTQKFISLEDIKRIENILKKI